MCLQAGQPACAPSSQHCPAGWPCVRPLSIQVPYRKQTQAVHLSEALLMSDLTIFGKVLRKGQNTQVTRHKLLISGTELHLVPVLTVSMPSTMICTD